MLPSNDPSLKSWVPVAAESDFSIQNLPFGVFRRRVGGEAAVGVAIGELVLDLSALHGAGLFAETSVERVNLFGRSTLNDFMAMGRRVWTEVRERVSELLRADNPLLRDNGQLQARALLKLADVQMLLPATVPNFVDFYSSRYHAANVGALFRDPANPLLPNWVHMPVGYNGRASSLVVSGVDVHRPMGQTKTDDAAAPSYGPSKLLDFELEVGFFTGAGNELGEQIPTSKAAQHIVGMVLVNDWSARDIQKWEYVPLGPFLGKSFGTSVSPWVVTLDALEPFRVAGPKQEPAVLPYLQFEGDWSFDMNLEVWLQSLRMEEPACVTRTNFRHMYWNILQQLAHMTVNGTNVKAGDLYASGTVSGPTPDSLGCLLELTHGGKNALILPSGEQRKFLADGDRVILRGWCQGDGYRVGFGDLGGRVLSSE